MDQAARRPSRSPARAALRLEGGIDRVDPDGTLQGWAWAPDEPKQSRVVVVTVDGHVVGRATCDRPRPDLSGRPGAGAFLTRLPPDTLRPGVEAEIALRDLASGQQVGSAVRFGAPARADAAPTGPLSGNVDRVSRDGWVSGWAFDPAQPEARVSLDILVDEASVGTTVAMNWRADLQQAGIGDGAHGFSYALPYDVMVRKGTMRVRVRESGSGRPLGQPALLRIGRLAESEQRVAELERQVRQLRGRVDELLRAAEDRPSVEERQARALFAMVAGFFQELADGTAPDARGFGAGRSVRAVLDELTTRLPALAFREPAVPQVLLLVLGTGPTERVHRCLHTLHVAAADALSAVVLLDPGEDERTALLPGLVGGLRYQRCQPGGLVAAADEAVRATALPAVALLDARAEIGPDWLAELLATLAREPSARVVGSAIRRGDGLLRHGGFRLGPGVLLTDPARHAEADAAAQRFLRPVDAVSASACVIDRRGWEAAGGFDRQFASPDAAAVALCARIQTVGGAVFVQPAARALWTVPDDEDAVPEVTGAQEDARRLRLMLMEAMAQGAGEVGRVLGHALVVDDSLPRPDHDAGSVIVLEQMQALRRLGWQVTFAPAGGPPPAEPARALLERQGIALAVPPEQPSVTHVLQEQGGTLDLVMLVRHANATTLGPRVRELAPRAKLLFAPADLHFLREQREAALTGRKRDTPGLRRTRAQELACVQAADATLVLSDYEQALLAAEADPTRIHLLRWIVEPAPPTPGFAAREGLLFVGNFAHRPNADAVRWYAETILPQLRRMRPGLVLHVAGAEPPSDLLALHGPEIIVHGWVADLDGLLDRVRLSVAPLRYGAGFKGKVATSLARGVPVVGTNMAMEGTGLADGDGVAIADAPGAFAQAVVALHDDPAAWALQAQRARERVAALYSRAAADEAFARLLAGLALPFRSRPDEVQPG